MEADAHDGLSDHELAERLARISLPRLEDHGVWTRRTGHARLVWLTAQACLPDGPVVYVSQVSVGLREHVRRVVNETPELLACRRFLETGRCLSA